MGANAQTSVPAFTAGQVLTAAQVTGINTGIPVFASSTERDAAFGGTGEKTLAEGQMAYLEDTNATQYYDGSSWAAVAGGKILQVVSTTKTDTFSASVAGAGETAVTGLTATITPSSATSKVLVMVNVNGCQVTGSYPLLFFRVYRGATEIGSGDAAGSRPTLMGASYIASSDGGTITTAAGHHLDSPASTSSLTYSVYLQNQSGSTQTLAVNQTAVDPNNSIGARTSSQISVMEVSA